MSYRKYLITQIKKIESNYNNRIKSNGFDFFYDCVNEYIKFNTNKFEKCFIEFGMEFKNVYIISDIVQKIFYQKSEKAILHFNKEGNYENFIKLIDSYYWLNLAFAKSLNEKKELKGEFFQDIVFSTLISYCFYPQSLDSNLEYLNCEYSEYFKKEEEKTTLQNRKYSKYYGYSDVFQLLVAILKNEENIFDNYVLVDTNKDYKFVIDNYLNEDKEIANSVLEKLAKFHIENKGESYLDTFNNNYWKIFPIEMISILVARNKANISNEGVNHPLISQFTPYLFHNYFLPNDELTKNLESKIIP